MAITTGWVIDEKTFPKKESIENQLKFLLKYAILAPSSHNTQPWKFLIEKNSITIFPDYQKKLEIADKEARELWISIGCALENLILAAEHFSFKTKINYSDKKIKIKIKFSRGQKKENSLFFSITKRGTNRRKPKRKIIDNREIRNLKSVKFERGTNAYLLENKKEIEQLIKLVKSANEKLYSNEKYKDELISWMRFNKREANKTRDGLTYKSMDMPGISNKIGKFIVSFFLNPKSANKEDEEKLRNSSGIILITSRNDTKKDWIQAGKTLEKILLKLTGLGINYAFINQPCQVNKTRNKLKKITKDYPQIILRIGQSKDIAHSPRKNIEEVLKTK